MAKLTLNDQARGGLDKLKELTEQRLVIPEPPQFPKTNFQPNLNALAEANQTALGYAHVIHDRLMAQIAEFQKGLTVDEEVGGYLAAFGRELLIHIEDVGYRNPYLIVFYGTLDKVGHRVELVQHTAQLNVLFVAVPKAGPVARRIGFGTAEK